jgi:hypothetical protein
MAYFAPLQRIFEMALGRVEKGKADLHFTLLCALLILRNPPIYDRNFQTFFFKDVLGRAEKETQASLRAFLAVIRGNFVSRSNTFWEWGKGNARGNPGVEALHLGEPMQDQSSEKSYTNLFFKHFVKLPAIDDYPDLVSAILVNFAARDLMYFKATTFPRLITEMGGNRYILPLSICWSCLVNEDLRFAEYAQQNPRNSSVQVAGVVGTVFSPLKQKIWELADKLGTTSLARTDF